MSIDYLPTDPDWPSNWQGCTIRGQFIDLLGEPLSGKVTFTPSVPSVANDLNKVTVVSQKITATLSETGAFEIVVAASDDPDNNPTGWTYLVKEEFIGGRTYSIEAPMNTIIDLVDVAPVSASTGNAIVRGPEGPAGPAGPTTDGHFKGEWAGVDGGQFTTFRVSDFSASGVYSKFGPFMPAHIGKTFRFVVPINSGPVPRVSLYSAPTSTATFEELTFLTDIDEYTPQNAYGTVLHRMTGYVEHPNNGDEFFAIYIDGVPLTSALPWVTSSSFVAVAYAETLYEKDDVIFYDGDLWVLKDRFLNISNPTGLWESSAARRVVSGSPIKTIFDAEGNEVTPDLWGELTLPRNTSLDLLKGRWRSPLGVYNSYTDFSEWEIIGGTLTVDNKVGVGEGQYPYIDIGSPTGAFMPGATTTITIRTTGKPYDGWISVSPMNDAGDYEYVESEFVVVPVDGTPYWDSTTTVEHTFSPNYNRLKLIIEGATRVEYVNSVVSSEPYDYGAVVAHKNTLWVNDTAGSEQEPSTGTDWVPAVVGDSTIKGTGFPEGVVTAPVGTEYTDTAATNGAVKWVKATGTGNTGWKVVYGDTGTRNAPSIVSSEFTPLTSYWRRIGDSVMVSLNIRANAAFTSGGTALSVPQGFRPAFVYNSSPPYSGVGPLSIAPGGAGVLWATLAANDARAWSFTWITKDPWPTTLPGTPA